MVLYDVLWWKGFGPHPSSEKRIFAPLFILEKDFSPPIFISLEMNLPPPFHHHLYLEKDLGPAAPLILEKYFPHPLILEK